MASTVAEAKSKSDRYEELLLAAAECFQTRGFAATSIDTVARHIGATKGRVYHYFPSKMDLFNAVRERAMDLVFDATDPGYDLIAGPLPRLRMMAHGHVRAMLRHHSYMQVLMDGLQMHRYSTTTEFQRQEMARHMERRDAYEKRFREVVKLGSDQGLLTVGPKLGITIQSFLSALNGPVAWYRPRNADTQETLEAMADDIVRFALSGLNIPLNADKNAKEHP